jgi:hypothetical protein
MTRRTSCLPSIVTGVFLALATVSPVLADVVVPNSAQGAPGGGTFLGPLSTAQRTYQLLIDDVELTGLLGQQISGVTWRLLPSAVNNYPAADATFTSFDIRLSGSVDPSARSLTFADNVVGPQTLVRSGPLNIPAGSFPAGGSPTTFGHVVTFDTPYTYTGGNLLMELRHTGISSASASVDSVLASGGPSNGYGVRFSAAWQSSYTATSGLQGNAVVTNFLVVPEPAAAGLASLAFVAVASRRTRRR